MPEWGPWGGYTVAPVLMGVSCGKGATTAGICSERCTSPVFSELRESLHTDCIGIFIWAGAVIEAGVGVTVADAGSADSCNMRCQNERASGTEGGGSSGSSAVAA